MKEHHVLYYWGILPALQYIINYLKRIFFPLSLPILSIFLWNYLGSFYVLHYLHTHTQKFMYIYVYILIMMMLRLNGIFGKIKIFFILHCQKIYTFLYTLSHCGILSTHFYPLLRCCFKMGFDYFSFIVSLKWRFT